MSFTKPPTWIGVLLIISILSVSAMVFFTELASRSDITLDDRSITYLSTFSSQYETALGGLDDDNSEKKNLAIVGSDNSSGQQSSQDNLGVLNFNQIKLNGIWGFFEFVYNLPTFIVSSFMLPIGAWQHIINIFTYGLIIALVLLGKKAITGN